MASVREKRPGRWELRVYAGKDPLTGKKKWASRTVAADGVKDAKAQAVRWEVELADDAGGERGSFGDLLERWMAIRSPRWSPSVRYQHRWMVDRHLGQLVPVAVERITPQVLDEFYAALAARGGACSRRPCRPQPCREHGARCRRQTCKRPPCPDHGRACASWSPCDAHPCEHGAPLSTSTVARVHVVVRAALEQGVRWGWIRTNPAALTNDLEVDEAEVTPPDAGDAVRLIAAAEEHDPTLAPFLVLAVATGARRGALCAARWSDVDLEAGTIRFPRVVVDGPDGIVEQPATRRKRSGGLVAIDPYTVATLAAHRKAQTDRARAAGAVLPGDAHLFSDDPLGADPWRPDTTSKRFRRVRARLGLTCRLHDLRHLSATTLVAAGVDVRTVAQRGGWRKASTLVDRYAHSVDAADRAAADILGRLLTQAPAPAADVVELG